MLATLNNFRDALFGTIQAAVTSETYHPRDAAMAQIFGLGNSTHAGQRVSHDSAIAIPAIHRGINIISNAVANVPFYVFELDDKEGKRFAKRHTSWRAVTVKPHSEIKTFDFIRTLTAWALQWGNGIAHIHRPGWPLGGLVELTPLLPDRTRPVRISERMVKEYNIEETLAGALYYETEIGGKTYAYPASDCIHIRGLGGNPYWGYDIVEVLAEALGGSQARIEFGSRFYGQGANPAGFIEYAGAGGLDEEAELRLRDSLKRGSEGMGRAHRLMLLEEGMKFHQWTIDPEKAQFLEGLQFDYRVLANVLGIKVHKLIDSANSSYNSLEMSEHEHKSDDILPWINQWKGEYQTKMLTERQQSEMTHSIDADNEKLQGFVPYEQRVKATVELANNNMITRDEGRARVNWGPSQDGYGNRHTMPMNIEFTDDKAKLTQLELSAPARNTRPNQPPDDPTDNPNEDDNPDQTPDDNPDDESQEESVTVSAATNVEKLATELAEMKAAHMGAIHRRIGKQAIKLASKDAGDFIAWVDRIQTENAPAAVQSAVDEFFRSIKERFSSMINQPATDDFVLSAAVAAEVERWTQPLNETQKDTDR